MYIPSILFILYLQLNFDKCVENLQEPGELNALMDSSITDEELAPMPSNEQVGWNTSKQFLFFSVESQTDLSTSDENLVHTCRPH